MFPSVAWFSEVVSQPFKRSQYGLFHGKMKQYGNNVPFSKHKTRRTWLPNVQRKRIFSKVLGEELTLKLTVRALRTIKKHGGLDKYLSKTRAELLGHEGMRLRLSIREKAQERWGRKPSDAHQMPGMLDAQNARERATKALGLPELATAEQTIKYLEGLRAPV